jgi:hypothetical protein
MKKQKGHHINIYLYYDEKAKKDDTHRAGFIHFCSGRRIKVMRIENETGVNTIKF